MEQQPKKAPIFCLKFPWDAQQTNNNNNNTSPSPCDFDTPFIFKSIQSLSKLSFNLFNSITNNNLIKPFDDNHNNSSVRIEKKVKKGLSSSEQWELEQRGLASALVSGKEGTVIEFYSPKCSLCNSLIGFVSEVQNRNCDWLNIVMVDAENDLWLPELLHYDIKYVPCFVMLDKHGRALGKTGVPYSRLHVVAGISHLLKLKRPGNS